MTEFNRARAEQAIMEARARDYSKLEIELAGLLERTLGFDLERRTYYDNFVLVQEDRHNKIAELAKAQGLLRQCRRVVLAARATVDSWNEGLNVAPPLMAHLKQVVEDFDIQHPVREKIGDE